MNWENLQLEMWEIWLIAEYKITRGKLSMYDFHLWDEREEKKGTCSCRHVERTSDAGTHAALESELSDVDEDNAKYLWITARTEP